MKRWSFRGLHLGVFWWLLRGKLGVQIVAHKKFKAAVSEMPGNWVFWEQGQGVRGNDVDACLCL